MLQQTRVEAVIPYYERFLTVLPDPTALASADEEVLHKLWEGLGYYSRVRNLQKAAQVVVEQYGGDMPASYEGLLALPGIGEYTAGAIASIAFGVPVPAVDGNVIRVFSRLLASEADSGKPAVRAQYRSLLLANMPAERPGDFNQAIMELGATVCVPNGTPQCAVCPLGLLCTAHERGCEGNFPVKAPKKARRIEERAVLLLMTGGKVLLHRRPKTGLLSGLWEFPNAEEPLSPQLAADYARARGGHIQRTITLKPAKHIFSHIEWRMSACFVICDHLTPAQNEVLASREELDRVYTIPSAFSAYRAALAEGWENGLLPLSP